MAEWQELMSEAQLFHRHFNVRDARLAFVWSRMRCLDESTNKKVLVCPDAALHGCLQPDASLARASHVMSCLTFCLFPCMKFTQQQKLALVS